MFTLSNITLPKSASDLQFEDKSPKLDIGRASMVSISTMESSESQSSLSSSKHTNYVNIINVPDIVS